MDPSASFSCLTFAGWALMAALAAATLWSAGRSTLRWKSRQYLISARQDNRGASLYAAMFNPIRRAKGIRPLRVIPFTDDAHRSEIDQLERADRLAREVHETLRHSPLSAERKAAFERQARDVPDNINQALWNLARLRRLYASIDPQFDPANQNRQAISDLENQTLLEMTQSVELLASLSVSLIQVELARGDRSADRLMADLDESNKRLVDLSSAYAESKQLSA
jgi:hypothetical protein